MKREVVAMPLFARRLKAFLYEYAGKGAVRFVEKMHGSYRNLVANISDFEEIAPVRRRDVGGKSLTVREYVLDAGARDFLVLFWVPPDHRSRYCSSISGSAGRTGSHGRNKAVSDTVAVETWSKLTNLAVN